MDSLDIWAFGPVKITHARNYRLPGYLFVEGASDTPYSIRAQIELKEALALATIKAENLVRALLNPQKVYVLKFGESSEKEHFHIIPRTAALLQHYLSGNDDAFPYNGAKITSWLWAHSSSLGHTEAEIRNFVLSARSHAAS